MVESKVYLDFLYYIIGKQKTDFELQIQNQNGMMSKRRKYSDIGFAKEEWWLSKVNARTLLKNEIVLDIDPNDGETQEQLQDRCVGIVKTLYQYDLSQYGIFKSNRAIHIHCFFNTLFSIKENKRKEIRQKILKKFGADLQKSSERATIALELAPHWKNGKKKEMIYTNLEVFDVGENS